MEPLYSEGAHKELMIESWSNAARELLIRGFTDGGPFSEAHTTNADRSRAEDEFQLHGMPEGLQVSPLVAGVRRGECYIRVTLMMDGEPVRRLLAGYLTDGKTLSFPGTEPEDFTDGEGLIRVVTGTNPAAGVEISESVPTNARWKLLGMRIILVTDANAANREVTLTLDDGTSLFLKIPSGDTHAASLTYAYNLGNLGTKWDPAQTVEFMIPIPIPLILGQGFTLETATKNKQVGDDYAAPVFQVEEWIQE